MAFRYQQSRVKVCLFFRSFSMPERRQTPRDKVIYGGTAEIAETGASRDCVVRNISADGAHLEFNSDIRIPKDSLRLTIARKGRSFMARVIWWRDNFVGVAFNPEQSYELPGSDLAERLRRSEKKKRQLQARIKELIGEG
jgi:PilZ domain-containing protein